MTNLWGHSKLQRSEASFSSRSPRLMHISQRIQNRERGSYYITISESLKLYGNELPSLPFLLRKSNLPFERFRNIRFYKRKDVDAFVRKRVRQNHPEIKEWYTVEEIMRAYDMERRSVYNFVFSYKIPKKKVYRTAYLFSSSVNAGIIDVL